MDAAEGTTTFSVIAALSSGKHHPPQYSTVQYNSCRRFVKLVPELAVVTTLLEVLVVETGV